jgi:hypothetical protein
MTEVLPFSSLWHGTSPLTLPDHTCHYPVPLLLSLSLLQVRLLTGVAFAEGNLQPKLLYASGCFEYGSWTFDRLNGPILQLFELTFRAAFVPKAGQQPTVSLKPAPPLIAPLPPDLFYPFLTSGAGAAKGTLGLQQWLVCGLLLWVGQVLMGLL